LAYPGDVRSCCCSAARPRKSMVEGVRLAEMVLKWEKGPAFAPSDGATFAVDVLEAPSSSPAINFVSRPSIHDPSLSKPGFVVALRPPSRFTGLEDGVPLSLSRRSSRLACRVRGRTEGPFLPIFDPVWTALQYLGAPISDVCSRRCTGTHFRASSASPNSAALQARCNL
jgi:hypothetical protein